MGDKALSMYQTGTRTPLYKLKVTSCQSENADLGCAEIIAWLSAEIGQPLDYVDTIDWEDRRLAVDQGEIAMAWMCGLWYVKRRDTFGQLIEPLVAPVMLGERYENRPNYFSDLMVRSDAPYDSLHALRGLPIAINEPDSHSGCVVLGHALSAAGLTWAHFSNVIQSGGHLRSLDMLLKGDIAAVAIDSTTFETELRSRPQLSARLRSIQTLGPSPIPPWTISSDVSPTLRLQLRQALTAMHLSPSGSAILQQHGYARFESISDADYAPIRSMYRQAKLAHGPHAKRLGQHTLSG